MRLIGDALMNRMATAFRSALRRMAPWLLVVAAAGCSQFVPAPALPSQPAAGTPHDAWARVLQRRVDDRGRVDFEGLARDRADLDHYVAWVHDTGPENRPGLFTTRAGVIAHHLNAYNALAMHGILDAGVPRTLAGLRKVGFFYLREVRVGGRSMSLYAYENDIIRPLGDERVHFALNCMVVGCPRLPRAPFDAATLDADLDREATRFLAEERNVEVDAASRTVRLSEIMKFYRADFLAKAPTLVDYVNRYRRVPIPPDYRVAFIPYDWTVNRQRP